MKTTEVPSLNHLNAPDRADIEELTRRIYAYQRGQEDEDRFKHYRLTRGVYGQRQLGVHMFRTKIPFGYITPDQLIALADISERYTNGRLHITTRQNIQLHYVKLNDSPAIWRELSEAGMTAREACGNTVRNLTASPLAGVDPEEPFDVSPYVYAAFDYFLRNPICQEMGRKIKPAFSSSEKDSAFTYFHDFGFIPRIKDGEKGFKVVVGGGLGAVSMVAKTAYEFLPAHLIIPFMEAAIRVFDRYGEREKRMKARMKFLIKDLGFERFMELVEEEWPAIAHKEYVIDEEFVPRLGRVPADNFPAVAPLNPALYDRWLATNVLEQKQGGYRAVAIRVPLGNLEAEQTRLLAGVIKEYASEDVRLTVQQGMILRYVPPTALPHLFNALYALNLGLPGYDTTADITACPGTDTCALGVTNSTGLAARLETLVQDEFPYMVTERKVRIKISGCMNACGQHMAANVGFHGSSIRVGERIAPAMQIVVGGGIAPDGRGFIAEKVIKVPTRRVPAAVRRLFADYETNATEGEYYNDYVARLGKRYFYSLLKDLGDAKTITDEEFYDWGQDHEYLQEIGVGECAGVSLDVIGAILNDASNKVIAAGTSLKAEAWADAGYHAYSAMITAAKALLLAEDHKCNTHIKILTDFEEHFGDRFPEFSPFAQRVLRLKKQDPQPEFMRTYLEDARAFVSRAIKTREQQLDKVVVGEYYKA
ncbi:nitrite/sulfite reductase [Lewinella sp. W8]|uniref:nitrite/sulfite reductase n=1 Tax=Lewinella sp. W8 TaxID=2528208 RepID=UPI0010680A27|nr:nitrite/sulfite reductase [Lewinella sp. W8]MTB53191.1 nitrite reductase [Lewinella sp. W8]